MKNILIVTPLAALAFAAPAQAATAYMSGVGGTLPGYSTITGPNGERVSTSWPIFGGDERISWNNISQQSAVNAQIAWLEAHQGEDNTLWTYSATSNAINEAARLRPDLFTRTTVIALAPPKATSVGYYPVPTPSTFRQYQVIVNGDSVADENGTSLSTHTGGYKNLNLQTAVPTKSSVLGDTNTTRSYYNKPGTTTAAPSGFRLFDMRTWFKKAATTTDPALGRAVPVDSDQAHPSRPLSATERPSAAERKAEKREARQAARAERRAVHAADAES